MANFIPFQQSSLFSNITGGNTPPLGAVPMNFATATPYKWNTDPIPPSNNVPESDFDMGVFCSVPANANHPMCQNNTNESGKENVDKIKIEGTDRYTTDNNFIPTDEEIANMTNEEYIANLKQRGWLKTNMKDYHENMLGIKSGQMFSPILTLVLGKEQEAKRKKIIEELVKRKFNVRGEGDNVHFYPVPNAQDRAWWVGNYDVLDNTSDQIEYQQEQLRQKNKDRILGGNPHADTYSYDQIINDAILSGGTVNPHELNFTASPPNYTPAQSQAGAGLLNQGNPHMMYNKKKKKYEKQFAGDY